MSEQRGNEQGEVKLHGWTFAMVPMAIVFDPSLSPGAVRLATYLIWRQGRNPTSWPSVPRMADELHASVRTVRRWRSELVEHGFVTTEERPGHSNLYRIHADPVASPDEEEVPMEASAQEMLAAVMAACAFDPGLATRSQWSRAAAVASVLRAAGKVPGDVEAFVGWWFEHDWRGKKGDRPKPQQLQGEWGVFEAAEEKQAADARSDGGPVYT